MRDPAKILARTARGPCVAKGRTVRRRRIRGSSALGSATVKALSRCHGRIGARISARPRIRAAACVRVPGRQEQAENVTRADPWSEYEPLSSEDLTKLTVAERRFLSIAMLRTEVNNGGFHQYLFNAAGDLAPDAAAAAVTSGAGGQ
jgi:hypothetical protein